MQEVMDEIIMEKYPVYKDSGESWIGEIPGHWEIKKLKYLFQEKKHTSNPELSSGSISFGEVIKKDDEKIPLATKASYQEVLKGEFLINPLNLNYDLISLRIALSNINVVVSPGYIVLKDIEQLSKRYFKYLLYRYDVAYMKLLGSGVRQTISFNHIANSLLPFPSIEEQTAIANFIDTKTAQIDKAIAQKEKLIELFKEHRQILTHNAVTKGLNPNVPMKDSGVEWIGEIPESWETKRLKFQATVNPTCLYKKDIDVVSFIPMENVEEFGGIDLSITKPIKEVNKGYTSFVDEDVLVAKITPCFENFKGAIAKSLKNGIGFGTTELHVLRAKPTLDNEYLFYITQSPYFRNFGTGLMYGTGGQKRVGTEFISNIFIPLPNILEQKKIVSFIYSFIEKNNGGIKILLQEIEMLKEYKATLINAAVTGKIKVS